MNNVAHINDNHTAPSTPSIAASAMLVELSISTWQGRKLDKRASQDVTHSNHAASGVASVNKKLLSDCSELTAIMKFATRARSVHYASTMPWSDTGLRLLPTKAFFKYNEQMQALQDEFYRLVDEFLLAYEWEIGEAKLRLGRLFNRDEYPTMDNLRRRFAFSFSYIPLPDTGDWRVDIGEKAKSELAEHYNEYYNTQLEMAMRNVWERAYAALERMSERLDYADGETKKVFHNTLVTNVEEIVELLKVCNITDDPTMDQAQRELAKAIHGIEAEDLRKDGALRRSTKQRVDAVLDTLPGLGM